MGNYDYIERIRTVIAEMERDGWIRFPHYDRSDAANGYPAELCLRLCQSHPDGPICHCPSCGRVTRMYAMCVCGTRQMRFKENNAD